MQKIHTFIIACLALCLMGCPKAPPPSDCTLTVTFEEIIINRETDPAPTVDTWEIDAQVIPPAGGGFVPIIPAASPGDQGARLLGPAVPGAPPFRFGPVVLGPKGQLYNFRILTRAKELDPPAENRGADDMSAGGDQQLEYEDVLCPTSFIQKYKQAVKGTFMQGGAIIEEDGLLEYRIRIVLDP